MAVSDILVSIEKYPLSNSSNKNNKTTLHKMIIEKMTGLVDVKNRKTTSCKKQNGAGPLKPPIFIQRKLSEIRVIIANNNTPKERLY